MSDFFKVKHSFNAGDAVLVLAGLRQIAETLGKKVRFYQRIGLEAFYYEGSVISTKNDNGESVCVNRDLFLMLKPLFEAQDYIESFREWKGEEVDIDIDLTRDSRVIPMPAGMLHCYAQSVFPQMATDLSIPWLHVPKVEGLEDKVIINRTQRYLNPYITYFFLKKYEENVVFSGTVEEHRWFTSQWDLTIPHLLSSDFWTVALHIHSAKFGVYNQSVHFHIADGLKSKRILELCPTFPNTFITGANGYQFYKQDALEYYFQKLMNE